MDSIRSWETNDVSYKVSTTTFTKTSRLPFLWKRPDGSSFTWFRSWNHERIANEARALKLVSTSTTIPVPKLLGHGVHPDGRQYLTTEFIEGITLNQLSERPCSFLGEQHYDSSSRCKTCQEKASSNALEFIQEIVLPQLAQLKSRQRGLGGFVMPPQWLAADIRPGWKDHRWGTLPLNEAKYVFQHGDLAPHNIMIDPQTLQVKALIDWEYAGYFLPGMERWPGTLDPDGYAQRSSQLASAIIEFIPIDYLACYNELSDEDRADWDELIADGELPRYDQLKQMAPDHL
ncbi:kinase-like domain-containing protein [Coniella lustricola]|uniref:Kinase-like domain-containing protein n=1 Tax=Coniella lustricola TaxID=2025994 RepID=A0A2T2ZUV5_9PEZI|nr:kinase-like domain-containing protein [Coniella lustricola]